MTSGGYQKPNEPAMASGPGPLSQRTDGGAGSTQAAQWVAGGDYGDGGLMGIQQGAPMSATPSPTPASSGAQPMNTGPQVVPLTEPSQRPDEPVTSGAASGPGPGPEALRIPMMGMQGGATAATTIQNLASRPDASPQLKQLAAQVKG